MKNYTLPSNKAHKLIRNRLRLATSIVLLTLTMMFIISINAMQLPPSQTAGIYQDAVVGTAESDDAVLPDNLSTKSQPAIQDDDPLQTYYYTVREGDTLSGIIKRHGILHEFKYFLELDKKHLKEISALRTNKSITLSINENSLDQMVYQISPIERIVISRLDDNTLGFEKQVLEVEKNLAYTSGTIENSVSLAGKKANLPDKLIMEMATILGWDIDFARDIRLNDYFTLLYEEEFVKGKKIRDGDIVALHFRNANKDYRIVRYIDSKGKKGYYFTNGKNVRKAFLRSPLDFAYISSHFNLKRRHPILHTIRAHKGVDYAAKTGTPIRTTGDGKIIFRGRKGGYGNTVVIRHGRTYKTLYAHMSKFAEKQRVGSFVKQGQVIGYVGSTGLSTGPHLHYEFQINGINKDPVKVKFPNAKPLPKKEMKRFQRATQPLLAKVDILNRAHLASMDNAGSR